MVLTEGDRERLQPKRQRLPYEELWSSISFMLLSPDPERFTPVKIMHVAETVLQRVHADTSITKIVRELMDQKLLPISAEIFDDGAYKIDRVTFTEETLSILTDLSVIPERTYDLEKRPFRRGAENEHFLELLREDKKFVTATEYPRGSSARTIIQYGKATRLPGIQANIGLYNDFSRTIGIPDIVFFNVQFTPEAFVRPRQL